jgi:predicted regulator of Ras-like GTPase activity (Roadblock/LC7/MglB family)
MATKEQELQKILGNFKSKNGAIGVAVVRRDGLMILCNLPSKVNSKAVAAMTAAIVGTGETVSREIDVGSMEQIVIESSKGKMIAVGAGPDAVFAAMMKSSTNVKLVLNEMSKIAKEIQSLIS